jgi:hypothetical protein
MFDLPDPFGPTTQVIPVSNRSEVAETKDLNPRRVRLFTYTRGLSSPRLIPRRSQSASLTAPYRERTTLLVIHASYRERGAGKTGRKARLDSAK